MVSDGKIRLIPLLKASCISCGLVSHWTPLSQKEVRDVYDADYDLGAVPNAGDSTRALRYAAAIAELGNLEDAANILEIGCGSGAVLSELLRRQPKGRFLGLEAAPQLAGVRIDSGVEIRRSFIEDLRDEDRRFDLVYAINVIEHAADPEAFLLAVARQLSNNGVVVIVFPDGMKPNLELLFADHINSFTNFSLDLIARRAGLQIIYSEPVARFEDFQVIVLAHEEKRAPPDAVNSDSSFHVLHDRRVEYLLKWSALDSSLDSRIKNASEVLVFGAGEAAALLRAYAPETWKRVSALVVDEPASSHSLGKRLLRYSDLEPSYGAVIVIATHPRSQLHFFERLELRGFKAVKWDHDIGQ